MMVLRQLLVLILFLSVSNTTYGAITFDSVASTVINQSTDHTTVSHTLGAGRNRIVIIATGTENGGAVTSVTYNGVNATHLATATQAQTKAELWYILESNLPAAGTYNAVATFTSSGTSVYYVSGVISLIGANQAAPEANTTNTNTSNTITSTLANSTGNAWIVDTISGADDGSFTASGTDQTERYDRNVGATFAAAGSTVGPLTDSATRSLTWTHSDPTNNRMATVLASIAPYVNPILIRNAVIRNAVFQ